MAALTIRHSGAIVSGQTVRGSGRQGSVGIHVVAGLDLVVIHACTIRGFDVGIYAESPVLIVNCEILRYISAGVVLRASDSVVEFNSFLDEAGQAVVGLATDQAWFGAAVISTVGSSVVRSNCFLVTGANRYFGLGRSFRPAWVSEGNVGVATNLFAQTAVDVDPASIQRAFQSARAVTLRGVTEESPGYGCTTLGAENLRLFPSSVAIAAVKATSIPETSSNYFDATTRLPKVDRLANHRPVEYLTAGAHEMSFRLTRPGRIRVLELIAGISSKPFNRVASGRDGVFMRLPDTASNPTTELIDDARDIQPSGELAVLSYREKKYGETSLYFKPERDLKVPFLVSAAASTKSQMNGATALTVYGWAKPSSSNADVLLHRSGLGRAQDRPVLEAALRFRGYVAPNLSVKCARPGQQGIDYTFVAESATLQALIADWVSRDLWIFFGFTWDRSGVKVWVASEEDAHLRVFPARPFVLDLLTETMVGGVISPEVTILDPNVEPICVGATSDRERGWHGYIASLAIDVGLAMGRADLESILKSGAQLPGAVRLLREVPQTDMVIGLEDSLHKKPPESPEQEIGATASYFDEIRRVVAFGSSLFVAAKAHGGDAWGAYRIAAGKIDVLVDNIPDLIDLQVDRRGIVVLAADDMALSRIDPDEGVRYEVTLPENVTPTALGVGFDNEYYLAAGAAVYAVVVSSDIASTAAASMEQLVLDSIPTNVTAVEVGSDGQVYALDIGSSPRLLRISTGLAYNRVFPVGLNAGIGAGSSLTISGIDFSDLGVRPGDLIELISEADELQTVEGEAVATSGDPLVPANAGKRRVQTVGTSTITVDVPLVTESPASGRQFEVRITRRATIDAAVSTGAPLVSPTGLARNPYDELAPVYVVDAGAAHSAGDPALGVIFRFRVDRGLEPVLHLSNLGLDLSTAVDAAVADNLVLPQQQVAAKIRSRLSWHMGYEPGGRRIVNSASPGDSDLSVPSLSLHDLLQIQGTSVRVVDEADQSVLSWSSVFESDPQLDSRYLNDEYENLSEVGVVTEDGVLLGRVALARMPYDPVCEVSTLWGQTLKVRS